jgi:hypothetical protein
MILFRLFAYSWIILCYKNNKVPDYQEFMDNVEAALNGDDNSFTVDPAYRWFNPVSIGEVWTGIGVNTKTPCVLPRKLKEVTFLSHGFEWNEELKLWMPYPETEKVLCSLAYNSSVDDVRWHYLRACALRLTSYGNKECRDIISGYIEYLNSNYESHMYGSINGIEMKEIRNLWRSDASIEALYCGEESSTFESGMPKTYHDVFWVDDVEERK